MTYFDDPADSGSAGHSWRPGKGEVLPPSQRRRSRFFTRRLFIFLVSALAILSLILAIPDVATALLMVTLGLTLPLMLAPTALLYLLAGGWPYLRVTADLETLSGAARWMRMAQGLAVSALCLGLVTFAPHWFSSQKAGAIEDELVAKNVAVNIGGSARRIAISGRDPSNWMLTIETRICGDECRALLLSGAAEWIRIVNPQSQYGKSTSRLPDETTFIAAEGASCAAAEDARTNPIHCVLVAPPRAVTADLAIVSEDIAAPRDKPVSPLTPVPGASRRLTARQGGRQVFARLEQQISVIRAPTLVTPGFRGINSGGLEIARAQQTANAITLKEMFAALGYGAAMKAEDALSPGLKKFSEPPTAEQINRAVSTLALPSDIAFNSVHLDFINKWVSQIRWNKPFLADDIPLVRKIMLDPRITRVSFLDQVLMRAEVLAALAPEMIELLATRKSVSNLDVTRAIGNALKRAKVEDLEPFKAKIFDYARNRDSIANAKEMLAVATRLGFGADAKPSEQPL